ncbi:hypothetical protein OPV22_008689 [Ensete ventricosum]|uniref:Uncharacterized protein n=1 Tax=Ensete ventricosum TaxID=4639 RepID=A0AAV8RHL8_ENSVE|nr:hypothetical protein OPV22_008689 [Ensete ventricosum]RWV87751.1 hypothetical protein GW17_00050228 [Ensete ventricosum]
MESAQDVSKLTSSWPCCSVSPPSPSSPPTSAPPGAGRARGSWDVTLPEELRAPDDELESDGEVSFESSPDVVDSFRRPLTDPNREELEHVETSTNGGPPLSTSTYPATPPVPRPLGPEVAERTPVVDSLQAPPRRSRGPPPASVISMVPPHECVGATTDDDEEMKHS